MGMWRWWRSDRTRHRLSFWWNRHTVRLIPLISWPDRGGHGRGWAYGVFLETVVSKLLVMEILSPVIIFLVLRHDGILASGMFAAKTRICGYYSLAAVLI